MLLDYVHPALNSEITAIGGYYIFLKEVTLPYQGRMIFYLVGCAVFNSTCCGSGGVSFARVPGFVHRYKYKAGVIFTDLITECEKMGDAIINVSEALVDRR